MVPSWIFMPILEDSRHSISWYGLLNRLQFTPIMSGFPVSWWDDHNPFIPYYMIMAHVMTNCITVSDCIAPFLRSNNCSTGAAPLLSSYFKRSLLRLSRRFRLDMASKSVGYFSFVCETMGGLGKISCHPWLNQNRRTLPRYLTIPLYIANGFELWHFEKMLWKSSI